MAIPFIGAAASMAGRVAAKIIPSGISGLMEAMGPAGKEFMKKGGELAMQAGSDVFKKYGIEALKDPKMMAKASQEAMEAFKSKGGMSAIFNSGASEFINKGGIKAIDQTMAQMAGIPFSDKIGSIFEKVVKPKAESALGKSGMDDKDGKDVKGKSKLDGKDDKDAKGSQSALEMPDGKDGKGKKTSMDGKDDPSKKSALDTSDGKDAKDNKTSGSDASDKSDSGGGRRGRKGL